ncbi:vegetative incompatibility protein HET-E-1-like [Lacerta agilis]|uniref:vegetative incompatibility protein HET-E-1-like n=1 Tax=Lacerta agilis TaxID=80427 RepID=UPI001419D16B|nr:vegetative incompatibility protein HET-E-1-like [Lacerta agilis]
MAMQEHLKVKERHRRPITALGYHSARRECLTGFEDGLIKWWDVENGQMSLCAKEHAGRVTHFQSWAQARLLFSSSNDGSVLVWAVGGTVLDRILLGYPIFTLSISLARHLLLCGSKGRLVAFPLDERRESGHVVHMAQGFSEHTHTDIVSCIACLDNQIYTAGYDKKLLIFDTYQTPGRKGLTTKHCIPRAHRAAITHLLLVRQQETTRVLSGSFDQTVGIWSQDGKLIQRLGPFTRNITGLCYVASVGIVWITSGTTQPTLYEPQSGEIVSQFISTFHGQQKDGPALQQLLCLPDSRHVIGTAKPQQILIWRYSELGCLTVLPCKHPLECLAYAKKEPVLLFSGDSSGMLQKWEKSYISPFIYSRESFHLSEAHLERRGPLAQQREEDGKEKPQPRPDSPQKLGKASTGQQSGYTRFRSAAKDTRKGSIGFTRALFAEELNILVVSAADGNIYLWEFENFIPGAEPSAQQCPPVLDQNSETLASSCVQDEKTQGTSSSCVAGFTCRTVLCGHTGMVTALAVAASDAELYFPYLLSGGWDGKLCLWDLHNHSLQNAFSSLPGDNGPILDLAYSPKRREFAFSSSTGRVFICAFNPHCADLVLLAELCGHKAAVVALVWHPLEDKWVSGAEDGSIRLWSEDGGCCVQNLRASRGITCLCIDQVNGCILAGVHDTIRVYDSNSGVQVQSYTGHQDSVKGLIHVPEMEQYVSVSLDGTVCMWKAYRPGEQLEAQVRW